MRILPIRWWVILPFLGMPAVSVAQVPLVREGKPVARIYTPGPLLETGKKPAKVKKGDDTSARSRTDAIRELNDHLEKMTGARLEVVVTDDPATVREPAVVLGELAAKL